MAENKIIKFETDNDGNIFYKEYEMSLLRNEPITKDQFDARKKEIENELEEVSNKINELHDKETELKNMLVPFREYEMNEPEMEEFIENLEQEESSEDNQENSEEE